VSAGSGSESPAPGTRVKTACGGSVEFEPGTPRVPFRGEWLYFCLPACQQLFEIDPKLSCLVEREQGQAG
jgi:hypothetical protein